MKFHTHTGIWTLNLKGRNLTRYPLRHMGSYGLLYEWELWGSNPRANLALGLKSNSLTTRTNSLFYLENFLI